MPLLQKKELNNTFGKRLLEFPVQIYGTHYPVILRCRHLPSKIEDTPVRNASSLKEA